MGNNLEIPKLSILTEEQIYGNNKLNIFEKVFNKDHKLNIFNVISPKAAPTDTAILRGAWIDGIHDDYVDYDSSLSGRTCAYWLQNPDTGEYGYGIVRAVNCSGGKYWDLCSRRYVGVRATVPYSQIKNLPHSVKRRSDGLNEITYGYYPGMALNSTMQDVLNSAYIHGTLKHLGVGCTFDGRQNDDYDKYFSPEKQTYFEYNGEIYARIRANPCFFDFILSNGEKYQKVDFVWTKVEPIVWLKHPNDDIMITEKEIIAGVSFCKKYGGHYDDFSKTELKWFLDNHLSKEIIMFNPTIQKCIDNMGKENHEPENETTNNYIDLYKNNKPIAKIKVKTHK